MTGQITLCAHDGCHNAIARPATRCALHRGKRRDTTFDGPVPTVEDTAKPAAVTARRESGGRREPGEQAA
jgi:hypothetical protein